MGACQTLAAEPDSEELEILPPPGNMQRTLRSVVRIQASWRGHRLRNQLRSSRVHVVAAHLGPFDYGPDQKKLPGVVKRVPMRLEEGLYTGEWNSHTRQREGRGVLDFNTGSRYEGFWLRDKPNGRGRIIYANGDVYEGEWAEGLCHGQGVLTYPGGRYEGAWVQALKHGQGEERFADGSHFIGQFFRGQRHGLGRLQWSDGASYEGEFRRGDLEGAGTYIWSDLSTHTGLWKKGKRNGHGCYRASDGRVFEGTFVEDQRQGRGVLRLPDGSCLAGIWEADRIASEEDERGQLDPEDSQVRSTSSSQY